MSNYFPSYFKQDRPVDDVVEVRQVNNMKLQTSPPPTKQNVLSFKLCTNSKNVGYAISQ